MFNQLFQGWCSTPGQVDDDNNDTVEDFSKEFEQYTHRIKKELERLKRHMPQGVTSVDVVDGDIRTWRAQVAGPKNTPYEGGSFQLEIGLPLAYPFAPPDIHFSTKIFHVNIDSENGYVCHDDFQWESASTIKHLIEVIVAMLDVPDQPVELSPAECQSENLTTEREIARKFLQDRARYDAMAREWTEKHAMK